MALDGSTATPARMTLVNLATQGELEAQFNPTELEESLGAVYARHTIPGLSHTKKHFVNTEDVKFKIELFNRAMTTAELDRIKAARLFLYSSVHPKQADSLVTGGAPRLLFIWPKFISLPVLLMTLRFRYSHFNIEGHPTKWTASCEFEEDREGVVTMEDILAQGTIRGNPAGAL